MIVTQASAQPYSLNLNQPWMTADGNRISQRHGWLITLCSDQGSCGTGDCAPFQTFGSESFARAEKTIDDLLVQFSGESVDQLLKNIPKLANVPATKFAFESALMDLQARAQSIPLFSLLDGNQSKIRINASAGNIQSNSTKIVQPLVDDGFQVIKLKVGFQSVEREVELLHQLCHQLPSHIQLRLDANRAWNRRDAQQFIDGIAELPVDSLEEPLEKTDLGDLTELQANAPFDLALDESLIPFLRLYPFHSIPTRRIIIKPTIIGGIQASLVLIRHAQAAKIKTAVTSTLESACGLYCTAHLAALSDQINQPSHHGLATSAWFQKDFGEPPLIKQGQIDLSHCKGNGYTASTTAPPQVNL